MKQPQNSPETHPGRGAVTVQLGATTDVPGAARMRRWARAALRGDAEITIRLVGGREGRSLNRAYRGRDSATNVLAFEYGRSGRVLRGDIVLCAPLIAREACAQRKALDAHYAHLTVHGVLHLRGYRHGSAKEARRMEARERAILRALGYPDPYRPAGEAPGRAGRR